MKKLRILYFVLIVPMMVFAQDRQIKGTVLNEENKPLPGASVIVAETNVGVATDFDGLFEFDVPASAKAITISYLGYKKQTIPLTISSIYSVKMELDANSLAEVVVTGYGSLSKGEVTGSSVQVKESQEVIGQYKDVATILQGRAAGVAVQSNIGDPGAAVSVRIRGTNSLRGNNEPLYVVDGILMDTALDGVRDNTGGNETQAAQNGLTGINPRDIESMTILKDAASTALYGSRGANGVVLITTKQGVAGKPNINVYGSTSISKVANTIPVLNGVDYATMKNELNAAQSLTPAYEIVGNEVFRVNGDGEVNPQALKQTNWQDDVFQLGYSYNYGATVSGGTEKVKYYLSGDLNELEGVVPNAFLNSANFRTNFSVDVTDRLKINSTTNFYIGRGSISQTGPAGGGSLIKSLVKSIPLVDPAIEDDEFQDDIGGNPFAFIEGYEENTNEKRASASIDLRYKITEDFGYQFRSGFNYRNKSRSRWWGPETGKGRDIGGMLQLSNLEKMAYTVDNIFTYRKNINKNHRINTTFVIAYDGSDSKLPAYAINQFPIPVLRDKAPQLGEAPINAYSEVYIKETILSYLARVNYTFKGKYVFNASLRADQSSKFKGDNKTGYFPSLSGAWIASREGFIKDIDVISQLKFRGSWGQVGNQGLRPYQTFSNFGSGFYVNNQSGNVLAVFPSNLANEELTWETTTQTNFGVDFGLWNSRLSGTFEIYKKETTDLLLNLPIPPATGFTRLMVNQGGIENKGLELSLNGILVDKGDFSLSLGGNISMNDLKIVGLGELPKGSLYNYGEEIENIAFYFGQNVSTGGYKQPANVFAEGMPVGAFYGYMSDGIYKTDEEALAGPTWGSNVPNLAGDVRFKDLNGDGILDDFDRSIIGDPTPDFTFGINTDFRYKNFYMSALVVGSEGNDILNGNLTNEEVIKTVGNSNVRPNVYFDAWSPTNRDGAFPRVGSDITENITSDRILEDGSFVRLSNVTVGYDLELSDESPIREVKLFISGNNLVTITDYKGFDPSPTTGIGNGNLIGVDWSGSPNIQNFVIGVNLKF